jgi:coenzyme F420-0:L-glutamate ligase/coenzyme F420-1:gamma-L-glutamate ligase
VKQDIIGRFFAGRCNVVNEIRVIAIERLPEFVVGMDLASSIIEACIAQSTPIQEKDVLVVTQKVISKVEGQLLDLSTVTPSHIAKQWATEHCKDPQLIEVVLRESVRIVRMDRGVLITETRHGFHCTNAGVDASNVPGEGIVSLLPVDSDASAENIRESVRLATGTGVAVIITDTWGRPWRQGVTNIAIGSAGMVVLRDYRGSTDSYGYDLSASVIAVVDELASTAELVMGKLDKVPAVIIRGYEYEAGLGSIRDLARPPEQDLFR